MASHDRFITLDSAAFTDRFKSNTAFEFTNILNPPLDNRDYDLEIAVKDISLRGFQTTTPICFDVACNLIEPYQHGDKQTQSLITFLPRRKLHHKTGVNDDNYWAFIYTYFPLRETHTEFDRFETITIKLSKSFGEWTHNQVEYLAQKFPSQDMDMQLDRTLVRLHVRKAARTSSREAPKLYLM